MTPLLWLELQKHVFAVLKYRFNKFSSRWRTLQNRQLMEVKFSFLTILLISEKEANKFRWICFRQVSHFASYQLLLLKSLFKYTPNLTNAESTFNPVIRKKQLSEVSTSHTSTCSCIGWVNTTLLWSLGDIPNSSFVSSKIVFSSFKFLLKSIHRLLILVLIALISACTSMGKWRPGRCKGKNVHKLNIHVCTTAKLHL